MKTYGLIWPDGRQELQTLSLDNGGNPDVESLRPRPETVEINGELTQIIPEWEPPQVIPLIKVPKPETGYWSPKVLWFEDRVERQWVEELPPPEPTFTAEEWLVNQGFQGSRPTACLYFKLQLDAANKVSPKLNAVQNWMNSILAEGVINPDDKRSDWHEAPYSFQEANTEALQVLTF